MLSLSEIGRPPHFSHQTFTTAVGSPLFTGHTRAGATTAAESPASALAHWPCCHTPGKSQMRWPQRQVGDRAPAPGQRCSIASATQAQVPHRHMCATQAHNTMAGGRKSTYPLVETNLPNVTSFKSQSMMVELQPFNFFNLLSSNWSHICRVKKQMPKRNKEWNGITLPPIIKEVENESLQY